MGDMTIVRLWRWGLLVLAAGVACALCLVHGRLLAACILAALAAIGAAVLHGLVRSLRASRRREGERP